MSQTSPQGALYTIAGGGYTARIAQVGSALAALQNLHGQDLVLPTSPAAIRAGEAGAAIAPWVNRLDHGAYRFHDSSYQLPLTEPDRLNAIHGLADWSRWTPRLQEAEHLELELWLVPRPGYPFELHLITDYRLDGSGLLWSVTAQNVGATPAPYGAAVHPYLCPPASAHPEHSIDSWTLQLPAARRLEVDERMLPDHMTEVAGTAADFRAPKPLLGHQLDHAYTDLQGDRTVTLRDPEGHSTHLACLDGARWAQVYTDDHGHGTGRRAVAVEAQTSAANAFNTGTDLIELEPGQSHTLSLRIWAD